MYPWNSSFEEFQKKIADFQEKEIELLNINKNLEKDITELKDNVANIKITNNDILSSGNKPFYVKHDFTKKIKYISNKTCILYK